MTDQNDNGSGDDKIGYGRPPKHTRFKKGQSGNPGGRPRKSGTVKIDIEALLKQPVTVVQNGKPCTMSPKEVTIRKFLKKALHDQHFRSIIHLIQVFEKHKAIEIPTGRAGGVSVLPNTMPWPMAVMMFKRFGKSPWTKNQLAKGRAAYLASRSEEEKQEDELMGYKDL